MRSRGWRGLAFAASLGATISACIFTIDPLPDGTGPGRDSDGAASDDARANDGALADAPAPGPDGTVGDADADAGPFCARATPKPVFCEDFDDGGYADVWHSRADPGASVTIEKGALRLSIATQEAGAACAYSMLDGTFSVPVPTRARLAYDVRVGHLQDDGGHPLTFSIVSLRIAESGGTNECKHYLSLGTDTSLQLDTPSQSTNTPLSAAIAPGRWTHVELTVDKSGGTPKVSVAIDGVTALAPKDVPAECAEALVSRVLMGLLCIQTTNGDVEIRLDDVVLWVE